MKTLLTHANDVVLIIGWVVIVWSIVGRLISCIAPSEAPVSAFARRLWILLSGPFVWYTCTIIMLVLEDEDL